MNNLYPLNSFLLAPMKQYLLTSIFLASAALGWAVPAQINYQGRLTDANGDPVTGEVSMSLKMFDAATAGNELYSEDIGTVTLDDNGVYSFQFGASGQSVVVREETIAIADGASTTFSNTLGSVPLDETLVVADGTYSWNIVDGNPGEQATATAVLANGFVIGVTVTNGGEGYVEPPVVTIEGIGTGATATAVVEDGVITAINVNATGSGYTSATVTIAEPPAPYVVNYDAGTVSVTYETAPSAGAEILATYEANDSSIAGALAGADSHWLELSANGEAQSPRERVLSVPFAQVAGRAEQAGGELAEAIASLNSNPDLPVVTQRGITKQGDPAITIPAGYRMRILSHGGSNYRSTYSISYVGSVRLSVAGVDYGFAYYGDLLNSYIDGPVDVTAYAIETTGWFSYEIGPIPDDAVLSRGITKQGDPAITIPAGYRMRILSHGGSNYRSTYSISYVGSVRLSVAGVDYGFAYCGDLLNSYIDGPVDVTAYAIETTGWFSYEIKKIGLGEQ
jgi:hypothetical protein